MGPQQSHRKHEEPGRDSARQLASSSFDSNELPVPQHKQILPSRKLQIEIKSGDLLQQKVDVIVNPWNSNLFRSWWRFLHLKLGLSGAIRKAAGPEPFRELAKSGHIRIGGAVLTGPGKLPLKGIIHVAGIRFVWGATDYSVRESVKSALGIAQANGFESIAFPLIGTGHGGARPEAVLIAMEEEVRRSSYRGHVVLVRYDSFSSLAEKR